MNCNKRMTIPFRIEVVNSFSQNLLSRPRLSFDQKRRIAHVGGLPGLTQNRGHTATDTNETELAEYGAEFRVSEQVRARSGCRHSTHSLHSIPSVRTMRPRTWARSQ